MYCKEGILYVFMVNSKCKTHCVRLFFPFDLVIPIMTNVGLLTKKNQHAILETPHPRAPKLPLNSTCDMVMA